MTEVLPRRAAAAEDGVAHVRRRARERLAEAEALLRRVDPTWSAPPYDPVLVAQALGIRCVEAPEPFRGAMICVRQGQPIILYRPQRDPARTRLALFHEIAHTLLPDFGRLALAAGPGSPLLEPEGRLEWLCDAAALELMMPADLVEDDLVTGGFGAGRVSDLCRRYGAGAEAVALRMIECDCAPACAVALVERDRPNRWQRRQTGTGVGDFAVTYAAYSRAWHQEGRFLARRPALPRASCLRRAARSGKAASGRESLPLLSGGAAAFRIEALPLPGRARRKGCGAVLAFVYPE